jgi:subtilisin family serine protease
MSTKHVILRSISRTRGVDGMPGAAPSTAAPSMPVAVEIEDIDRVRAATLARTKEVVAVAPVMPMKLIEPVATDVTAQPAAGAAWGIDAVGATASPFTGDGVIVAVLDTGIDKNHPAFAGVELIRKNFTTAGENDQHGHGTHCAGTIFGRNVGGTRIGVATGVKRALIGKVLGAGGGGSDQIVQAIQWAVSNGATVISMSLGIDFPGFVKEMENDGLPTELATSVALEGYRKNVLLFERMAALLAAQGEFMQASLIVAAAGNESRRDQNAKFEIAVAPPAVADGIISVAALGRAQGGLTVASFSNFGARVSGPGVEITSAKLGGGLTGMSGTSMATPHVAGVAALWAQKLTVAGQLSGQLLADKLVGSATTTGLKAGFDPADVGAGIVRAPQN